MDILNFISWIKGGRVVTTVDSAKTLLPVGLKDNRRDDGYLAGAISVQDLAAQLTPEPTYKVFTALLTQSGGDDPQDGSGFTLTIGVTYEILENSGGADFTIVGAPNNDVGTKFIATGTNPNWGNAVADLGYNTGAPVVTVLENTIGNIWFTYSFQGTYLVNSDGLFTLNKSIGICMPNQYVESPADLYNYQILNAGVNNFQLNSTITYVLSDDKFGTYSENSIEIRVYN